MFRFFILTQELRLRVAILREQGSNGYREMVAAFYFAGFGFDSIDVHMSDLLNKWINLSDFKGLAACGSFSLWRCTRRWSWLGTIDFNASKNF